MNDKKNKKDGHMHSPYCPHGTNDTFEMYVEKAIEEGLEEISFTEHMPYPFYFIEDIKFLDECSPTKDVIENYFEDLEKVKNKYQNQIKINTGLEVDYIEGLESDIAEMLNSYGDKIQDSILSVHFIKLNDKYLAVDWKPDFEVALKLLGSVEKIYDEYYQTLLKAIKADLGDFKPKRIGHPNLVRIFNELHPLEYKNHDILEEIVKEIKKRDYEVDVNTAGLRKPHCNEIYVSDVFKDLIEKYNVRKVYGSDSHSAKDVGRDFDKE